MLRYLNFILVKILLVTSLEAYGYTYPDQAESSLLSFELKNQVEKLYNLNIKKIHKFKHGLENDVFKIENYNGRSYVLRISKGKKSRIEQEVLLLQKLHYREFFKEFVPRVVSDCSNRYVNEIDSRVIVLFDYINGVQKKHIEEHEISYIVSRLSEMHKYTSTFVDLFDKRNIESSDEMKFFLQELLEMKIIDKRFFNYLYNLVDNFNSSLRKYKFLSAVHRDIHWKNLIFTHDNQIFLIDFDDFCVSSPILELSVLFRTLCLDDNNIHIERFVNILKEYNFFGLTGEYIDTKDLINMINYDLLRVAKSKFENMKIKKQDTFEKIDREFKYIKLINANRKKLFYLINLSQTKSLQN